MSLQPSLWTFTVGVRMTDDGEIEFVESELNNVFHELELGEVDRFEPEDYRNGEEPE